MILHLIPENVDGCAYHRVVIPMHNLSGLELAQTTFVDGIEDKDLEKITLVVFNRDCGVSEIDKQIKRLKRLNIPYVMDIDDFWSLDKKHILHKNYKESGADRLIKLFKSAAAVTTTHQRLANKVKKYNDKVFVIPNTLDAKQTQWESIKTNNPSPRFGWVGGVHHIEDIRLLVPAIKQIHQEDKVHLALGGFTLNDVYYAFDNLFSNAGRYSKYKRIDSHDVFNYGNIYNTIDVCLIPLVDNKFNNCKSNLKILEAGYKGKACIVSRCAPYIDDFTDEEVLFVDENLSWYDAIMLMQNSPSLVNGYADKLSNKVRREFDIKNVNYLRENLYKSLTNGKQV